MFFFNDSGDNKYFRLSYILCFYHEWNSPILRFKCIYYEVHIIKLSLLKSFCMMISMFEEACAKVACIRTKYFEISSQNRICVVCNSYKMFVSKASKPHRDVYCSVEFIQLMWMVVLCTVCKPFYLKPTHDLELCMRFELLHSCEI